VSLRINPILWRSIRSERIKRGEISVSDLVEKILRQWSTDNLKKRAPNIISTNDYADDDIAIKIDQL